MNKFFLEQVSAHPKTWVFSALGVGLAFWPLLKLFGALSGVVSAVGL